MTTLHIAGRPLPEVEDAVRRYCGLPWSGGAGETWAFRYFDDILDPDPTRVGPVDVLTATALHPGLRQTELAWFWEQSEDLRRVLALLPDDVDLGNATSDELRDVQRLPDLLGPEAPGLSLLSKVLHRKRPRLVPMLDRAALDRYRPMLPGRSADAWPALVQALHDDLCQPQNEAALHGLARSLQPELSRVPSALRLVDISIWMQARFKTPPSVPGKTPPETQEQP